jgi:membrane-bound lytic murein transglycosylase B
LGVRKADGSDLPSRSIPAALILADKGDRKAYLVYRNFCSIMSYNPAFKYALSIGLLADQLQ